MSSFQTRGHCDRAFLSEPSAGIRARIAHSQSTHARCQSGTQAASGRSRPPRSDLLCGVALLWESLDALSGGILWADVLVCNGPSRPVHKRIHIGRSLCILGCNQSALICFKWRHAAHASHWMPRGPSLKSILFSNLLSGDYAQCRRPRTLASHLLESNGHRSPGVLTRLAGAVANRDCNKRRRA